MKLVCPPTIAGNDTGNADCTESVIPVQLNKHKYKTVHITAPEASETALNVLECSYPAR